MGHPQSRLVQIMSLTACASNGVAQIGSVVSYWGGLWGKHWKCGEPARASGADLLSSSYSCGWWEQQKLSRQLLVKCCGCVRRFLCASKDGHLPTCTCCWHEITLNKRMEVRETWAQQLSRKLGWAAFPFFFFFNLKKFFGFLLQSQGQIWYEIKPVSSGNEYSEGMHQSRWNLCRMDSLAT